MLETSRGWDAIRPRKPVPDMSRQSARAADPAPEDEEDAREVAPDALPLRAHVPAVNMERASGRGWDEAGTDQDGSRLGPGTYEVRVSAKKTFVLSTQDLRLCYCLPTTLLVLST